MLGRCSVLIEVEIILTHWIDRYKHHLDKKRSISSGNLLNSLLTLSLADSRLLVALDQDFSEGSTNNGSLGLLGLLLGRLFLLSFFVLTPIQEILSMSNNISQPTLIYTCRLSNLVDTSRNCPIVMTGSLVGGKLIEGNLKFKVKLVLSFVTRTRKSVISIVTVTTQKRALMRRQWPTCL